MGTRAIADADSALGSKSLSTFDVIVAKATTARDTVGL